MIKVEDNPPLPRGLQLSKCLKHQDVATKTMFIPLSSWRYYTYISLQFIDCQVTVYKKHVRIYRKDHMYLQTCHVHYLIIEKCVCEYVYTIHLHEYLISTINNYIFVYRMNMMYYINHMVHHRILTLKGSVKNQNHCSFSSSFHFYGQVATPIWKGSERSGSTSSVSTLEPPAKNGQDQTGIIHSRAGKRKSNKV